MGKANCLLVIVRLNNINLAHSSHFITVKWLKEVLEQDHHPAENSIGSLASFNAVG